MLDVPRGLRRDLRALLGLAIWAASSAGLACSQPDAASKSHDTAVPLGVGGEASEQNTTKPASVNLSNELGPEIVETISNAEPILFADLKLVAADEALELSTWNDAHRIAGYPIIGSLQPVEASAARTLREMLLEGANYDPELRWRCLMQRAIGFRFVRGASRVDAALIDPCWFLIWSFERNGEPTRWGAVFSLPDTARIYRLMNRDSEAR